MTTEKAIAIIYDEYLNSTKNELKARQAISDFMILLITRSRDSGSPLTPESIKAAFIEEAEFCQNCKKAGAA